MNVGIIISLLAAVVYIPLLIMVFLNRPWQRQHRLFILNLFATMAWGVANVVFRSDLFPETKLFQYELVICFYLWAAVQFHYFVASFYYSRASGIPYAYILTGLLIALTLSGYVVSDLSLSRGFLVPVYSSGFIVISIFLIFLIGRDYYFLWQEARKIVDPVKRNQIMYLLCGLTLLIVFSFINAFSEAGKRYPVTHLAAVLNAGILTYAVIRHRLLDMQLVLRQGIVYLALLVSGVGMYAALLIGFHRLVGRMVDWIDVGLGVAVAVAIAGIVYLARNSIRQLVEQLFHRRRYGYRRELLQFTTQEVPRAPDLKALGSRLLSLIAGSFELQSVHLLLPTSPNGDFISEFTEPKEASDQAVRLRRDSPVVQWLSKENRYLLFEEIIASPEFLGLWAEEKEQLARMKFELLLPIMNEGKLVGILALGKKNEGRYSLEDITLLESITQQLAANIEKEYFHEQLKRREEELAWLNELTRVITSSLNIREVYSTFVSGLRKRIDVDWAAITAVEGEELIFEALFAEDGSPWQQGDRIPLKGTGTELALKRRRAIYEPDLASGHKFWTGEMHLKQGIKSIVYVPLIAKGEPVGSLLIGSRKPNAFSPEEVKLLEQLASHVVMPVENSRLYARAEQRARIDELTGLFNRRHLDERLKQEIDECQRYGGTLSVMMLDLDFFKIYNDKYGHKAGDLVLKDASKVMRSAVRSVDMVFRYGGDEFVILLPQTDAQAAFVVAERVRAKIAQEMRDKQLRITASIGVATWPSDGVTPDSLVNAADRALYYAKQTGGNRTCVASQILQPQADKAADETGEKEALSVIYALAATIEARDPYTYGHSRKVSTYAVALAEAIGLPPDRVAVVSTAALLHDIGKIGIPDEVLNNPGELDAKAWELIWSHPRLSATIVGHVFSLVSCLPAILHHHERWDGKGYPVGLRGENIPIEARILAIADAFDAMTSSRPYRGPLSYKQAIEELKRCAGTQFDPKLVEAFIPIALSIQLDKLGVDTEHRR